MPLTVNVGISRKSSANYQSAGVSINLTAELDQSLLADPPRLQTEIDRIYAQAETALDRKAAHDGVTGVTAEPETAGRIPVAPRRNTGSNGHGSGRNGSQHEAANGYSNGVANGVHHGGPHRYPTRPATESQVRALRSICKRHRLDLDHEAHEEFGLESAEQLDVRQASQLIDLLKGRETTGNGRAR
jgi:hypothetical protein